MDLDKFITEYRVFHLCSAEAISKMTAGLGRLDIHRAMERLESNAVWMVKLARAAGASPEQEGLLRELVPCRLLPELEQPALSPGELEHMERLGCGPPELPLSEYYMGMQGVKR